MFKAVNRTIKNDFSKVYLFAIGICISENLVFIYNIPLETV